MIGQMFIITVPYGLDTRQMKVTVEKYLGNNKYVLRGENNARYIRKLVWEELNH